MSEFRRNIMKNNALRGGNSVNPNLVTGTREFTAFNNAQYWSYVEYFDGCRVLRNEQAWTGLLKSINVAMGKWYTFSATVKAAKDTSVYFFFGKNNTDSYGLDPVYGIIKWAYDDNQYHRVSWTFFCTASRSIEPRAESDAPNKIAVCKFKLEKGKKSTAWCD